MKHVDGFPTSAALALRLRTMLGAFSKIGRNRSRANKDRPGTILLDIASPET
jgi:hypothetical protein